MLSQRITLAAFVLFIPTCSTTNDAPFTITNKATGFCLVRKSSRCLDMRWTTGDRLFVTSTKKCLGAQGRSAGSEVSLYDCDDSSPLQRWECKNETLLALKDQALYVEVKPDQSISLSRTAGPNNELTVTGTSSGACSRTYRELYTIDGNANGKICAFPFLYKDRWFADCTTFDSSIKRLWCAINSKFEYEQWGYCPTSSTDHWAKNPVTGAFYQVNTQSALTWAQADTSCRQQGAALLSITDPHQQAFVSALMGAGKHKVWIGLVLDPEHGWQWSDRKPFRYLRWNIGNPAPNPGHSCAFLESAGEQTWQSQSCGKKQGYVCYKDGAPPSPPQIEQGFCAAPWIPYNGHCFHLQRVIQTWSDAQKECRKEGGDLVSIRHVEDQSFVISQLGFASADELWIGLNDIKSEGLFDWSDHSTVSFTSWEFGKPSTFADEDDCVLIRGENGNWADRLCSEKHGFICMKQSSTESTGAEVQMDLGCKSGWKRHGSYCYFVGAETKTFDEAKEDCKSSDSYLVDVSNGVDNAFLASMVGLRPERYFWLGLSNQKNLDQFVWTNTDSVKFTHWNVDMPGYRQGCVAMTTGILAGLWDLLPCSNKEKYICKHLAEGAVVTVPPPTQSQPQCEEGWVRMGTRSVCAKLFTGPRSSEKTWYEARDYCRAIGGELLSIHGIPELHVGSRFAKAWIGLHIPDVNTGYAWSDGTPVNYQHWQEGEPNNHNNDENCVEFRTYYVNDHGSWNDANCEGYNDWFCQILAGVTPKIPPNNTVVEYNRTSDGWLVWRGSQYFISGNPMSMEDARHFCQQRHGDLVSINSKDENTFLWKQISRHYGAYYIGLSVDLDGSFWWMDGSTVGLQKWEVDQPSTDTFDFNCVVMNYYMGYWRSCNCGNENQFICKRRISAPVNSTAAPTVAPKGGCPLKWSKFDSKCYSIIFNRRVVWEEARSQCSSMGGYFASIPTRRVQTFLTTKMSEMATSDLWIGLSALKQDGFYWSDGKSRKFTNWNYSKYRHRTGTFNKRWNEGECVVVNSNPALGVGKWSIRSCNDTNGFICIRDVDPNLQPQTEPAVTDIYVPLGNDSIKFVNGNLTWYDARKHCQGDKSDLASLRNDWTQAYVELLAMKLKVPLWIGLNKQESGYFRFIDGWQLRSVNWAEGEPSRDRPCVYVDEEGKWRTAFCNRTMNSVCKQSTDPLPLPSTAFPGICPPDMDEDDNPVNNWLPFKGHCYLFITDEIEWANAASNCVRHGGSLASIEDPAEQEFIKGHVEVFRDSTSSFWVGLFKTHAGEWKWLDKTVMEYINWAEDEPENDFGSIGSSDGLWRTGSRWHDKAYVCKAAKVIPVDQGSGKKPEPHGGQDPRGRVHTSLIVVLVITLVSTLMVVAFFIYKKSPRTLPTFDNPLYFDRERSQPDVVDTNKLIENAEEENLEPIISL
uniref:Mannose receptor, C type 1b n=1 Tax=Gasterosteus aculeatus aculeatus TaxID=481459 RepID=A0AAQ4S0W6_GASAC|nr:macrophage mannose receptor 1-like [Gasterosteus aculeatus aculeatus]